MIVKQAIYHLETLLAETPLDLSREECESIRLAVIVLKTFTPNQEALIDAIMTLKP